MKLKAMPITSTRGQKSKFVEGERVFCFEPDPTKAKVLYESKILEVNYLKDFRGRRVPEYLVHFQGWNSSWDRCVPEEYILRYTDENKALQKQLAFETSELLKRTKKKKKTVTEKVEETLKKKSKSEDGDSRSAWSEETSSDDESDVDVEPQDLEEITDTVEPFPVCLPQILKDVLEKDYYKINTKNELISLPCSPNIVELLEGYVRNFGMNLVCSPDRKTVPQMPAVPAVEKNLNLCKEVMDGIRIYFDLMLPLILLYSQERSQYEAEKKKGFNLSKQQSFSVTGDCKLESGEEGAATVTRLRSSSRLSSNTSESRSPTTTRSEIKQKQDSSPRKKVGRPKKYKQEGTSVSTRSNDAPISSRLRHHSATDCAQNDSPSKSGSPTPGAHPVQETKKRMKLSSVIQSPRKTPAEGPTSPSISRPATLGTESQNSSSGTGNSDTVSAIFPQETSGLPLTKKMLNSVLSWKLVPYDLCCKPRTSMPSLVYGAHHLLRLFVKFPEILGRIKMREQKKRALQIHLEMFVNYLADKHQELFSELAYCKQTSSDD